MLRIYRGQSDWLATLTPKAIAVHKPQQDVATHFRGHKKRLDHVATYQFTSPSPSVLLRRHPLPFDVVR